MDFPELIKRKTALIQQTPALKAVLADSTSAQPEGLPDSTVIGMFDGSSSPNTHYGYCGCAVSKDWNPPL